MGFSWIFEPLYYCLDPAVTIAKEAIIQISINKRYGKPSNIEDNSDDSDIEPSDEVELEDSTLFWV